jgi:hypothetical protein
VLYPAIVDLVDGGQQLVHAAVQEHREAERLLALIEGEEPSSADVQSLLRELEAAVAHHVQEEESELLPRLRQRADEDVLDMLARALAAVESEASGDADAAADMDATIGR